MKSVILETVGVGTAVWQNWRARHVYAATRGRATRGPAGSRSGPLQTQQEVHWFQKVGQRNPQWAWTLARAMPDTRPLACCAPCSQAARAQEGRDLGVSQVPTRRERNPNGRAFVLKRCSWSSSVAWPASHACERLQPTCSVLAPSMLCRSSTAHRDRAHDTLLDTLNTKGHDNSHGRSQRSCRHLSRPTHAELHAYIAQCPSDATLPPAPL